METVQELTDKQTLLQAQLDEVGKQIEQANAVPADATPAATAPELPTPTPEVPVAPLAQVPVPEPHLTPEVPAETPVVTPSGPVPGSVVVPVTVPSAVPSDTPVIDPNHTLEERLKEFIVAEIAAVLASPIVQQDLNAVETKVGQLLVGLAGTGAVTFGSLLVVGQTTSVKVLLVGLGINLAHLVLNWGLGAFPKK